MENIKQIIEEDFKQAFKAKNTDVVEVLKMIKSALKNEEIAGKQEKLSDEKILEVISREAKKRRESIEAFNSAGRTELAEKEKRELDILSKYMPKQLDDAEIEKTVIEKAKLLGAKSTSDMGKLMGVVMKELKGKAEGDRVKKVVAKILSAK